MRLCYRTMQKKKKMQVVQLVSLSKLIDLCKQTQKTETDSKYKTVKIDSKGEGAENYSKNRGKTQKHPKGKWAPNDHGNIKKRNEKYICNFNFEFLFWIFIDFKVMAAVILLYRQTFSSYL